MGMDYVFYRINGEYCKFSRLIKWMLVIRIKLNLGFKKNGFNREKNGWLQVDQEFNRVVYVKQSYFG